MNTTIEENIKIIRKKIDEAAILSGRRPEEVTLMAVSKTKPLSAAEEAAKCGVILGENYVQEFKDKFDLNSTLPWHFIGHLQTNKVKYVVPRALMIHSVDSYHLAEKISIESKKAEKTTNCLVEINSGAEESKFGLTFEESQYIIKEIAKLENISLRGLMTIAPPCSDPEENRRFFKKMKALFDELKEEIPSFDTLSMGMSADYITAVQEGATIVRVGTAIFGERNYNK